MLDFNNAKSVSMGFAAIQFRNDSIGNEKSPSNIASFYALNALGDGWFRVAEKDKLTYGYGLKLKYIEITSQKSYHWGYGVAHKASIIFEANDESTVKENVWLYTEHGVKFEQLKDYISKNAKYWVD